MAATPQEKTTTDERAPRSTASPLDGHAPPTASTGTRPGRAIAALVLGIIAVPAAFIPIAGLILGIVATVLGATTRSDIRRRNLDGYGQAKWGMILGIVAIVLSIGLWVAGAIMVSN